MAHYVALTDGTTTVEFGGSDSRYQLQAGSRGFVLGSVPIVKAEKPTSLLRAKATTIAHAHGNRAITLQFWVTAGSRDLLQAAVDPISRLIEQGRRYWKRKGQGGASEVYLTFRLQGSTKQYWAEVVNGSLDLPDDWATSTNLVPDTTPYIFGCTLFVEALPGLLEGPRPILQRAGSASISVGSGCPLQASNYVVLPDSQIVTKTGGILSAWFYVNYTWNDNAAHYLFDDTAGYLIVQKTSGNALQISAYTGAWKTSSLTLSGGTFGVGWHHVVAQWGDVTNGLRLYLDGVSSSGADTGNASALGGLGNVYVGINHDGSTGVATGAVDDVRRFRSYDGIFLTSVADLYSRGLEANSLTTCTRLTVSNKGDTASPRTTDVSGVRGDLAPRLSGEVQFSTGANSLGRLRFANRISPPATSYQIDSASAALMNVSTVNVTDAARPEGQYIRSSGAAAPYTGGGGRGGVGTGAAATGLTNGIQWFVSASNHGGRYRLYGALYWPTGSTASVAQVSLTQGANYSQFAVWSPVVYLSEVLAGRDTWTLVDFGPFSIPVWAIPPGKDSVITILSWDDGNAPGNVNAGPLRWDFLLLLPFEDDSDLLVWTPTAPMTDNDRLVVDDDRLYRRNTTAGYDAVTGQAQGRFPQLLPGMTNRLFAAVDRATTYEHNTADSVAFLFDYWPRYLLLR